MTGNRHPSANRHVSGDPLAGVERVLVDGSNLAHALARSRDGGRDAGRGPDAGGRDVRSTRITSEDTSRGHAALPREPAPPPPPAAVIASIRAAFPATVRVEVVFDGPGTPARAASNLFVSHSGRAAADRVIEEAVEAQLRADGPAGTWGILVVTDDRGLRELVQRLGARSAGTAWLASRIGYVGATGGPSGTAIGHRRPPNATGPRRDQPADRLSRRHPR